MNERIKELALQAMTYVTHNPKANKLNSGDMFDEKFAELIVAECTKILADNNEFRGCVIISKHFGVELRTFEQGASMTKDEALKLALSTLNEVRQETFRLMRDGQTLYAEDKVWSTIISIKEVLAQEQEPVAWEQFHEHMAGPNYVAPQRTWVGLTDEEIETLIHRFDGDPHTLLDEVNARLKEKNT